MSSTIQSYIQSYVAENASEFANMQSKSLYDPKLDFRANLDELPKLEPDQDLVCKIEEQARSVAAVILKRRLVPNRDSYRLDLGLSNLTRSAEGQYAEKQREKGKNEKVIFGENENFREELEAADATAFLVTENVILTAAHVICPNKDRRGVIYPEVMEAYNIVFGFRMKNGVCQSTFPKQDVYTIDKVVAYKHQYSEENFHDWTLLKLDRKVKDRKPLGFDFDNTIVEKCQLYMLGHPSGLPLKYTRNGLVKANGYKGHFEAELDAFHGNSGSPVFDRLNCKVIGILCCGNKGDDGDDVEVVNDYQGTGNRRLQHKRLNKSDQKNSNFHEICQRISHLDFVKNYLLAHQNDVEAQEILGKIYVYGLYGNDDLSRSEKKAYKWFKKVVDVYSNRSFSLLLLGVSHFSGHGAPKDLTKAMEYFNRMGKDDPKALYYLGLCYEEQSNYELAFSHFLQAAEKGNSDAQLQVGMYYLEGKNGINRDINEALKWLKKAGDMGKAHALQQLGHLYGGKDNVVAKNLPLAFSYFEKTADAFSKEYEKMSFNRKYTIGSSLEKSYIHSQYMVGMLCLTGLGTELDIEKAIIYLEKAANLGHEAALEQLAVAHLKNNNHQLAFSHFLQAAEKENSDAQLQVGRYYLEGKNGINRDINEALKWLKKAGDRGEAHALQQLGHLYFGSDWGIPQNLPLAFSYFEKAADVFSKRYAEYNSKRILLGSQFVKDPDLEKDYSHSQFAVGVLCLTGHGTEINIEKAIIYLEKAANLGHGDALNKLAVAHSENSNDEKAFQYHKQSVEINDKNPDFKFALAVFYYQGRGIPKDEVLAEKYFKEAIQQGLEEEKKKLALQALETLKKESQPQAARENGYCVVS